MVALAAGIGVGMVTIGAGLGIGIVANAALQGIARQPEAANDIKGAMILCAAFIEGVALFSCVICLLIKVL